MRSLRGSATVARLAVALLAVAALLAVPRPGHGMTWALLIGVEKYQNPDISPAQNAANDPELLAKTLDQRGDVDPDQRIRVMNDRSKGSLRPTRANIRKLLADFAKKAGTKEPERDRLIVFFSGHGMRDKTDKSVKTYLAPIDCDPDHLDDTALELAEVRQALRSARVGSKLLILDACHSGAAKGGTVSYASAGDIKNDLKDETGIYTLASCEGEQKSYPLDNPKKPYGLFTFWLNLGLEGAADENGTSQITADGLFSFVRPVVTLMSGGKQTPERIVQAGAGANPEVLRLLPEKVLPGVSRLSTQVHEHCKLHGITTLCVAEFSILNPLQGSEQLKGPGGQLLATKIRERLRTWPSSNYKVIDGRTAASVLGSKTGPQSIMDIVNLKKLKEEFGAGALLWGSLEPVLVPIMARDKQPDLPPAPLFKLRTRLTGTDGVELASSTVLIQDPDFRVLADGDSGLVPRQQVIPKRQLNGRSVFDLNQIRHPELKSWMQDALKQRHPLFDPDCPYRLEVRDVTGTQPKQLYYKDGDQTKLYVKVRRGERVTLYVANRTGTTGGGSYDYYSTATPSQGLNKRQDYNGDVFVRLWVDGLNVIDQKPELPEEAWPWMFPPQSEKVIRGWHTYAKTEDGQMHFDVKPFKIVAAPHSLAYRTGYTQDIGQVTAIFYAATEMNWLRKLGFGEEENVRLRVLYPSGRGSEKLCLAYPLAYLTIYYCDEDDTEVKLTPAGDVLALRGR
jgi:hypothetical protein